MKYYLAIDIGASSGRHIVGWRKGETLETKEVYRFPNGVKEENGHLTWDPSGHPGGPRKDAFFRAVPPHWLPVPAF